MDKQVKISEHHHKLLLRLTVEKGRSLKDYLEQTIEYFHFTQFDPKEVEKEGIKQSINKLDRRIVSFFRVQEKEKIDPLLDELAIISKQLSKETKNALTKEDFDTAMTNIYRYLKMINDNQKR